MNKEFEKIQAEWYSLLEKNGFKDIEAPNNSKSISSQKIDMETVEYYKKTQEFLNEYDFKSEFDRTIWQFYSDGMTVRDIALKTDLSKSKVDRIIQYYKAIMMGAY